MHGNDVVVIVGCFIFPNFWSLSSSSLMGASTTMAASSIGPTSPSSPVMLYIRMPFGPPHRVYVGRC